MAGLCILYKVNSNSNHCLFIKLPSASILDIDVSELRPQLIRVSRCTTSKFARSFLPAQVQLCNDLPNTVFDIGTLDGFKSAVNRWLPRVVFSSVFRVAGACGVAKVIYN